MPLPLSPTMGFGMKVAVLPYAMRDVLIDVLQHAARRPSSPAC
jgi:hypothetical protein